MLAFKKKDIKGFEVVDNTFKEKSKEELFQYLLNYFNTESNLISRVNAGTAKIEKVSEEIKKILKPFNVNEKLIEELICEFKSYVWGYWKLDPLIDDDDISDIKILAPNNTRVKVKGKRKNSDIVFKNSEEIEAFANSIATKNGTNLSVVNSIQAISDTKTSSKFRLRINITTPYVNSVPYPYITIRKIPKKKAGLDKLVELGMITEEEKEEIKDDMEKGMSIILCGKGASGKTTLLNSMIDLISLNKSGLVIQESEELFSEHPDLMFQRVRKGIGEGKINYSLRDLSINGLLIDLDYFVIGEIKGDEAIDFFNASYTGSVVLATIHSNSSTECANKFVHYMKNISDYKKEELLEMMKDLDKIYFLKNFELQEVTEIEGYDPDKKDLIYNTTFLKHKRIHPSCEKIIKKKSEWNA